MKKLIAVIGLALCAGCSSLTTATIKSEGVIVTTVDVGMKTWANYVNSGKATQQQVDTVKSAYNTYYNAQLVAEGALEKMISTGSTNNVDINTADASVATAENSLLTIINSYIK